MQTMRRLMIVALLFMTSCTSYGGDWPMWRYDAGHTAVSPDSLPNRLHLNWERIYAPRKQVWDDPLNHDLMQYDRIFEPVVKDGRMFLTFNDSDKVVALDVNTGDEQWVFYTDGPVRFSAVASDDMVYFCSDDGYLYCVAAADGKLRWKFFGAPAARKAIGNKRMISAWPARGGPVISGDRVYFAASIWPFMGTYIWCLDTATGDVVWVNDSTSSQYIKQPHSAPSFAGVAPQGSLVVVDDYLLVPGGRSVPAAFDRHTGESRHFLLNQGGKGNGGSLVLARGKEFYVHTRGRGVRAFELKSGNKTAFMTTEPALDEETIFVAEEKTVDSKNEAGKEIETQVPVVRAYRTDDKKLIWEVAGIDGSGDIIKAGNRLYVAGKNQLTVLQLSRGSKSAKVAWTEPLDHDVKRLLAAAGKLFAVTSDGSILCYGPGKNSRVIQQPTQPRLTQGTSRLAEQLIRRSESSLGFVLFFGEPDLPLLNTLLGGSSFQIVVVDSDVSRVERLRREYDAAGLYGERISFHAGTIDTYRAPPYVARFVIIGREAVAMIEQDQDLLAQAYESVRPYGGCLVVLDNEPGDKAKRVQILRQAGLEKAMVAASDGCVIARRVGALPGAADWTHQYGDIANTVKSNDSRVKLPLGLLWFGGSSNMDVLPRHSHGPPEQVVGGRLFIEGMNSLSCRDVYTGQVLWKRTFGDLGTYNIYYNDTYRDTPLDTAYNQVHIPGANGRGANYVATSDAVYIVVRDNCHVLDVDTGETVREIHLPEVFRKEGRQWGFIGVYEDVLLGGAGFANYRKRLSLSFEESDSKLTRNAKAYGSKSFDTAASSALVAFDRHTGRLLWSVDARNSFIHNGVVAGDGKVFCLDKLPRQIEDKLGRRGARAPETYRIIALDYQTGELIWEQTGKIFGTWLGYSEQFQLLLHAGAAASDRLKSETGQGMTVYQGQNGKLVWRVEDRAYSGPCIIHNDTILTNANSYRLSSGAFNLLDGSPKLILNPLTQEPQEWQLCRTYGCNSIIASENLLTFRSGAAGFYDLKSLSGTGNWGGFKSGCTANLVVADGVLNAPDYTRTCSCGYQNQTSLALVHMPEVDLWTLNDTARLTKPGATIRRIGVNFGAPGDRVDESGTLWIEYPTVGGEAADIPIELSGDGDVEYYRHPSLGYGGAGLAWVGSSGVENVHSITIPLAVKGSPNEVQFRVSHANDDAEEKASGSVNLKSSDLELVKDKGPQTIGIRFEDVTIPRGKTIAQAYIQFTCDETTTDPAKIVIRMEDISNSPRFSKAKNNVSSRKLIEPGVEWFIPAWNKAGRSGEREQSPNLTEMVQAMVNRPSWKAGNAIVFVITGEGHRVAKSYDDSASQAPTLYVKVEADPQETPPAVAHTVRLQFAEPEEAGQLQREFDILVNDRVVEVDFDIAREAGGPRRTVVREYRDIMLRDALNIKLKAKTGKPIISGIEIVRHE